MTKRIISIILAICVVAYSFPMDVSAKNTEYKTEAGTGSETELPASDEDNESDAVNTAAAVATGSTRTVTDVLAQHKFTQQNGHGFAAEQGNNLIDKIKGKNTLVIGDNNVKNGADRKIISRDGSVILIQDKYYSTGQASIDACFDEKGFRYTTDKGLMQIEVPKDQYDDAVLRMEQKIREGKVPGITDVNEAKNIVKKGNVTYKQAQNLAKSGTIDSLKYDATNGIITASGALGISTILNYAVLRTNGITRDEAIKESAIAGIKTGASVFCVDVIAGQLTKTTKTLNVFKPSTEALTKALGKEYSENLIKAFGQKVITNEGESAAESATKQAAKVIRSEALVAAVSIIVFSVPDAIDMFRGRVSKKQFVKNFAVTAASVTAGVVGAGIGGSVGTAILPGAGAPVGAVIGGLIGSAGGGWVADKIADHAAEDDANEMYAILEDEYSQLCDDYLINEHEAEHIADSFGQKLSEDKNIFKDMYQSKDRADYGRKLLEPIFEEEISKRSAIEAPTEEEMRTALKDELEGVVFIH